jgi:ubiquinone/menaquinone biosynthesis C-methylase UbiE
MTRLLDRFAIATHDLILQRRFDPVRAEVVGGAAGRVLEIGAGTGLNFRFYRPGVDVTAIEPARALRAEAERRAASLPSGAAVRVVDARAEALPFDAGSFDAVVVTFVLCSVDEVARALGEVRRVLRPGGTLRLAEHVVAERRTTARVQRALQPIWAHVLGGCSLVRSTATDVERAGFDVAGLRRVALPLPRIAEDGVVGVAVRP